MLDLSIESRDTNAPIRFVTTPGMDSTYSGGGVAVDKSGEIYVGGGAYVNGHAGTGAQIFEFSPTASGSVASPNIITSLYNGSISGIAIH
jgi:hypothetical protein